MPSYRPIQHVGLSINAPQLVTGSGEGQNLANAIKDALLKKRGAGWTANQAMGYRAIVAYHQFGILRCMGFLDPDGCRCMLVP